MSKTAEHLYTMEFGDTHKTEHGLYIRTINGWNFLTKGGGVAFIPMHNEFKPKEVKPVQTAMVIKSDLIENLVNYWNTKDIIKCRAVTPEIEKQYRKIRASKFKDRIKEAIDNYAEVLHSDDYFDHKWSLITFLKQKNCIPDFINEGEKWINYKSSKESKPTEVGEMPARLKQYK